MSKKVTKVADKVDAKLDEQVSKIPIVGKHIAAATSGGLLLFVAGLVVGAIVW